MSLQMNQMGVKPGNQNPEKENLFWKFWLENEKIKIKHKGVELIWDQAPLSTLDEVNSQKSYQLPNMLY